MVDPKTKCLQVSLQFSQCAVSLSKTLSKFHSVHSSVLGVLALLGALNGRSVFSRAMICLEK